MSIRFNDVSHCFDEHRVLREINLEIGTGEIVCTRPLWQRQSTLLRLIAGLESVQQGSLMLDGVVLADAQHNPPPEQRAVGLVFQDHVLFHTKPLQRMLPLA